MKHTARSSRFVPLVATILASQLTAAPAAEEPLVLRRRPFLGTQLGPVSDENRQRQDLPTTRGAEILQVFPNSSASAGGLRAGDVLVVAGETDIDGPAALVKRLGEAQGGETLRVTLYRDGKKQTKDLTLIDMPRETSDRHDVVLGAVDSAGGRLRTILTRPRAAGRRPALYLLPGLGPFTMESVPLGGPNPYQPIIDDFSDRGWVTLRVDKPGCGDSLGGPIADVDFATQLDGFRQGLAWLKAQPDVDPERIVLFGHSMGGVWAPLVAAESPVQAIAVYGTIARTWPEYVLDNNRRQMFLAGVPAGDIDRQLQLEAAALTALYREKLPPDDAADKYPEFAEWIGQTFAQGRYYSGCHYTFWQQFAEQAIGEAWEKHSGKVLSLWGEADFIASQQDHALIAQIVNRGHSGQAEFLTLPGIDHDFHAAATQADSRSRWGQPGRPASSAVVERLRAWSEAL